jgi:hypothetical protein
MNASDEKLRESPDKTDRCILVPLLHIEKHNLNFRRDKKEKAAGHHI